MIANPNVQLVKIKTVTSFKNMVKVAGNSSSETDDNLGLATVSNGGSTNQPETESNSQPQTSVVKRRFTVADVVSRMAKFGTKKVSFEDSEASASLKEEGDPTDRRPSLFKRITLRATKGSVLLFVCYFVRSFVCLFVCSFVRLFVCLFVCLIVLIIFTERFMNQPVNPSPKPSTGKQDRGKPYVYELKCARYKVYVC